MGKVGEEVKQGRWKIVLIALLAVLAVGLSLFAVMRPQTGAKSEPPRIYAVGDSITEGDSPNFAGGQYGPKSWVAHVDSGVSVVGGWAKGGTTTREMAANVTRIPPDGNMLVMLAGTNDLAQQVPFTETRANLQKIAQMVGADRVVLSAIPPRNQNPKDNVGPADVTAFNEQLKQVAKENNWEFIDPYEGIRTQENTYLPGMNASATDGVHPSEEGATLLGRNISQAISSL